MPPRRAIPAIEQPSINIPTTATPEAIGSKAYAAITDSQRTNGSWQLFRPNEGEQNGDEVLTYRAFSERTPRRGPEQSSSPTPATPEEITVDLVDQLAKTLSKIGPDDMTDGQRRLLEAIQTFKTEKQPTAAPQSSATQEKAA